MTTETNSIAKIDIINLFIYLIFYTTTTETVVLIVVVPDYITVIVIQVPEPSVVSIVLRRTPPVTEAAHTGVVPLGRLCPLGRPEKPLSLVTPVLGDAHKVVVFI